jgi:hypothetical protein
MVETITQNFSFLPTVKTVGYRKNAIILFSKSISHILHQSANACHQQLLWPTHRSGC